MKRIVYGTAALLVLVAFAVMLWTNSENSTDEIELALDQPAIDHEDKLKKENSNIDQTSPKHYPDAKNEQKTVMITRSTPEEYVNDAANEEETDDSYMDNYQTEVTEMDRNSDGIITREEYTGEPSLYEFYDDNKDGVIDQEDIEALYAKSEKGIAEQKKFYQKAIDHNDLDGNGELSLDELVDMPKDVFSKIDSNRDEYISFDEIEKNPFDFFHYKSQG